MSRYLVESRRRRRRDVVTSGADGVLLEKKSDVLTSGADGVLLEKFRTF